MHIFHCSFFTFPAQDCWVHFYFFLDPMCGKYGQYAGIWGGTQNHCPRHR